MNRSLGFTVEFKTHSNCCTQCQQLALPGGKRCVAHLEGESCLVCFCCRASSQGGALCAEHLQELGRSAMPHLIKGPSVFSTWLAQLIPPPMLPAHLAALGDNLTFESTVAGVGVYYDQTLKTGKRIRSHTLISREDAQLIRADRQARGLLPPSCIPSWR